MYDAGNELNDRDEAINRVQRADDLAPGVLIQ